MPKATNTHSECVILITFLLQQWLHERAAMLHCTYVACQLVIEMGVCSVRYELGLNMTFLLKWLIASLLPVTSVSFSSMHWNVVVVGYTVIVMGVLT